MGESFKSAWTTAAQKRKQCHAIVSCCAAKWTGKNQVDKNID